MERQPEVDNNKQNIMDLNKPKNHMPVVYVQNGYKAYSKGECVLRNVNMTVPRGTVYGLLGASGCGKTTMLSCIVGLRQLDSGEIKVFGHRPGSVESGIPGKRLGYMPQDIAIYPHLTIKELLQYFGGIYGLLDSEILSRIRFLTNFLHLPRSSTRIISLSGGEQRRTSFAAALLGEPELLILDEPTIGMDPLLRETIWDHLLQLTQTKKTTVVITTHYIEEARQAHTVGLMRNGRMLVEDSPVALLNRYSATLLEDVVLEICRKDQNDMAEATPRLLPKAGLQGIPIQLKMKFYPSESSEHIVRLEYSRRYSQTIEDSRPIKPRGSLVKILRTHMKARMNRIKALIIRNIINFIRNPVFCVGILILPVFYALMTRVCVSDDVRDMRIGVVNGELPDWKGMCQSDLGTGSLQNLSCRFLNTLPGDVFNLVSYKSREVALNDVHEGKLCGLLTIPEGYSENLTLRSAVKNFADRDTIERSTVTIQLDQSNFIASSLMTRRFYDAFQIYSAELASEFEINPLEFTLPLEYREPVYGTRDASYNQYIVAPVMLIVIFFVSMSASSLNYIYDKNLGTMERSRSAGVQNFDFLVASSITEGLAILAETLLALVVLVGCTGFQIHGSYALYTLLCVLAGLAGQSWGFIIGIVISDETSALLMVLFIFLPLMLLSGVTWPLEAVPGYVKYFSYCLPCTLATKSLRSVATRGVGITHPTVWPGIAVVIVIILISSIVAVVIYRMKK